MEFIAKEEEFIRRNMAGQNTRQAQGRLKRLERVERIERPRGTTRRSSSICRRACAAATLSWPRATSSSATPATSRCLSSSRSSCGGCSAWRCGGRTAPARRRFSRRCSANLPPLGGEVWLGGSVKPGYLSQMHDGLRLDRSILDTILDVQNMPIEKARGLLGRYLFTGDDVFKPISLLSGGERSRVALAVLTLQGANFLLLDEPTNHLDLQSQEVLQDVLVRFCRDHPARESRPLPGGSPRHSPVGDTRPHAGDSRRRLYAIQQARRERELRAKEREQDKRRATGTTRNARAGTEKDASRTCAQGGARKGKTPGRARNRHRRARKAARGAVARAGSRRRQRHGSARPRAGPRVCRRRRPTV